MNLSPAEVLERLRAGLSTGPEIRPGTGDDADGSLPMEVGPWLVRLRLLDGVPFAYLVPDAELLPEESIRWFYVDRRWTDALVQGALAVGTVNSDDRTQLTARYPAIRDELDQEERNLRRVSGSARYEGGAGPITGFLMRSRVVSGWPALHVRAFFTDPADDAPIGEDVADEVRLLRLERLAPAVLLCLFDGVPTVVHVEEPRQGIQFGFDLAVAADGSISAQLRPRDVTTFIDLPGQPPKQVPFRAGGTGVVDIQALERLLAPIAGTGAADGLNSCEYALQLIRKPFRQVFGDVAPDPISTVFTATVSYQIVAAQTFTAGGS